MEKLSRVMFLLLCHITSIVKQVVFHVDADRIAALVASLDGSVTLYALDKLLPSVIILILQECIQV